MFAHIFKNSFITTPNVPSEIKHNYDIEDISKFDDVYDVLEFLQAHHKNDLITFYIVRYEMFNPILQQYCYYMGLDYNSYMTMIEHARMYIRACVLVYEPMFDDSIFRPIEERRFSLVGQAIPWNYGLIPFEYWINHVGHDEYADKIYHQMYKDYLEEEWKTNKYARLGKENNDIAFSSFLKDPKINMCFNDEFSCLYFNKRLMYYLQEKKFILRNIKSDITEADLILYNKNHKGVYKNYDHQSVY